MASVLVMLACDPLEGFATTTEGLLQLHHGSAGSARGGADGADGVDDGTDADGTNITRAADGTNVPRAADDLLAKAVNDRISRWSVIGRGSNEYGWGAGSGFAGEFFHLYHAAFLAGVLPESAVITDYHAKYAFVLEVANALLWQRRWVLAHTQ
jgi:hypothetical protein